MSKESHISPERLERFTWQNQSMKFVSPEDFDEVSQLESFVDYDVWKNENFNPKKSQAYKDLVERAKLQYPKSIDEIDVNPKTDSPILIAMPESSEEINLYAYWQGFGYARRTPKIKYLLVAQDWGNFLGYEKTVQEMIVKGNADEYLINSSPASPMDRRLFELFKILDRDIGKRCDDVFFTNFCLGYRIGKGSGGMSKKMMMHDAQLFKELCMILEPENILCLGRVTSACAYEALTGYPLKMGSAKNYNEFLDSHPSIILQYGSWATKSRFFPLAHCGALGTNNRNHGYNLPEIEEDLLFKQREDWQQIAEAQNQNLY